VAARTCTWWLAAWAWASTCAWDAEKRKTGGRDKPALLVNALEAVVAALYRDGGIDVARDFIARFIMPADLVAAGGDLFAIDYKSPSGAPAGGPHTSWRISRGRGVRSRASKDFTVEVVVSENLVARGGEAAKRLPSKRRRGLSG